MLGLLGVMGHRTRFVTLKLKIALSSLQCRIIKAISGLLLRFLLSSINQNAEKLVRIYVVSNFLLKFKLAPIDPAYRKTKGPLYRIFASIKSLHYNEDNIFSIFHLHHPLLRV